MAFLEGTCRSKPKLPDKRTQIHKTYSRELNNENYKLATNERNHNTRTSCCSRNSRIHAHATQGQPALSSEPCAPYDQGCALESHLLLSTKRRTVHFHTVTLNASKCTHFQAHFTQDASRVCVAVEVNEPAASTPAK